MGIFLQINWYFHAYFYAIQTKSSTLNQTWEITKWQKEICFYPMLISSQDAVLSEYKSFRTQKDNVLSYSRRGRCIQTYSSGHLYTQHSVWQTSCEHKTSSSYTLDCQRCPHEPRVLSTLQCQSEQPSLSSAQVSGNNAHWAHTSTLMALTSAGEPKKFEGEEWWALNDIKIRITYIKRCR